MKKMLKRLCTGFLALATVVTALPTTPVHAESKQYWTESAERVGIIEKVMNDGSIGSTFNEGYMKVEGETAYCIDINTDFKNGYKTRADASSRMSADQISDVALSLEYVKTVWRNSQGIELQASLSVGTMCGLAEIERTSWLAVRQRASSYDEIPKATQDEVFSGARAFVKENKGRYECGGYIYLARGRNWDNSGRNSMLEMRNFKRLPVIPALQTVTGITLSLVRHTVSLQIRTARNSLPPLRLMKTEIQMLQR